MNLEIGGRKPHAAKRITGRPEHLDLGQNGILADNIEIPLVMLALASLGHAFVAETLRYRRPLNREGQFLLALRDHARKGWGHLRAERKVAIGLVVEVVDLLTDLFARLARQQLVTLDHARIVRFKPRRLTSRTESIKHLIAPHHIFGIEVAHPAWRLETDFLCHNKSYYSKNFL